MMLTKTDLQELRDDLSCATRGLEMRLEYMRMVGQLCENLIALRRSIGDETSIGRKAGDLLTEIAANPDAVVDGSNKVRPL